MLHIKEVRADRIASTWPIDIVNGLFSCKSICMINCDFERSFSLKMSPKYVKINAYNISRGNIMPVDALGRKKEKEREKYSVCLRERKNER